MPDVASVFQSLDWKDLDPRLKLMVRKILSGYPTWRGETGGVIPGGRDPDDFVSQAKAQFMCGDRTWNDAKSPFQNFFGVIRSNISNLARSTENAKTVRVVNDENEPNVAHLIVHDASPNPEAALIYKDHVRHFLTFLQGDREVHQMASLILNEGLEAPDEFHMAMGIKSEKFQAIRARLKRQTLKYRKEYSIPCDTTPITKDSNILPMKVGTASSERRPSHGVSTDRSHSND